MPSTDAESSADLGSLGQDDLAELGRIRAVVEARLLGEDEEAPRIGRYAILSKLGEGGMGIVYAGFDESLDRRVAIKLLRASIGGEGAGSRLLREAQALAKLSHPNVVHVYEVGEHDGRVYLAMEYVRGQSLRHWAKDALRSWREVLALYAQAGRGLAAAHAAGLVHRDFKPDNAIVGLDGRVRVLDFGLARRDRQAPVADALAELESAPSGSDLLASPLTHDGSLIGTPAYMAAEQFLGEPTDARTDQFGFCVALWEALYGERPFGGSTRMDVVAAVTSGRIREPPRGSRVPSWVRAALVRGLAPVSAERWPSMDALLAALAADPTRRRRAIGLAIGLVAAAGGVVAGEQVIDLRRAGACTDASQAITDDWHDEARAGVRESLLATKLGYAADTADRTIARMDAWVGDWIGVADRTCRAAEIDRTLTEDLRARSERCLADARARFVESAAVLASADPATVERAHKILLELPPPSRCEDPAWLARMPLPPPEIEDEVADLRSRSARLHARVAAGHRRDAVAEGQALADEAAALGWAPLSRDFGLHLASLQLGDGAPGDAEATIQPVFLATLRDGDARAGAAAARTMLNALGRQHRFDEARRWWGIGHALLDAVDEPDVSMARAALDENLGDAAWAMADVAEARRWFGQALATYDELLGAESLESARVLVGIANNTEDIPEAIAMYERAAEIHVHVLGPQHPNVAVVLNNTAQDQLKLGLREEAAVNAAAAHEIFEAAYGPESRQLVISMLNLADAKLSLGDVDEAERLSRRAIELDPGARASTRLVTVLLARGDLEEAAIEGERAVDTHVGNPMVVIPLGQLAYVHALRGRLDEAERVVARMTELLPEGAPIEARATVLIARAGLLIERGRYAEARPLLVDLENACNEITCLDHARVHLDLMNARVAGELDGDREDARALARRALERMPASDLRFVQERAQVQAWLAAHGG